MAAKKDGLKRAQCGFDPQVCYATAANLAGLRHLLSEFVRNCILHGNADNVFIEVVDGKEIRFLDDGDGISGQSPGTDLRGQPRRSPREAFAMWIGKSKGEGTGNGARYAALATCQLLEVITCPKDEPGTAYRAAIHLPAMIDGICDGTWEDPWREVPRTATPFPEQLASGTLVILKDFRASHRFDPFNEARMRDTAQQITAEEVRRVLPNALPPFTLRQVSVNGKRMEVRRRDGHPLWSCEPAKTVKEIRRVSGNVQLSEDPEGSWCTIGGSSTTVLLRTFLDDLRGNRPDLARRLPSVLWDKRNEGYIFIEALEGFPTQSREHFDPHLYQEDRLINAIVDWLATVVAPRMEAARAEFERRPATERNHAIIAELIANGHKAQSIAPGSILEVREVEATDHPVRPEDAPIDVNRVTIRLERAEGSGEHDRSEFRVTNALPGETFTWDDHGKRLLSGQSDSGDRATVQAIRQEGPYAIDVQSNEHPNRRRTVHVDIYVPQPKPKDAFRLRPENTEMTVGDEKRIAVGNAGPTSMEYTWRVEWVRSKTRTLATRAEFDVLGGGRSIVVRPSHRGDMVITCTDTREPTYTATCTIDVCDRPVEEVPPGTDDPTGTHTVLRPTHAGRGQTFEYRRTRYRVVNAPAALLPWMLNGTDIELSDSHPATSGSATPESSRLHIAWCIASSIAEHRFQAHDFGPLDADGRSRVEDEVLRYLLLGGSDAERS